MRTPDQATRVTVTAPTPGARARVCLATGGAAGRPHLRPMLLDSDATSARVALVPDGALLLAGDAVCLQVDVGPGLSLELVEPAGTVAYDMRGAAATWDVSIALDRDSTLIWHGEPFVVAAGAHVRRTTTVELGPGARLALRETLVLGRDGESAGALDQRLDVRRADGAPVLVESLGLDSARAATLLGGRRVLDSVLVLGAAMAQTDPDCFVLEGGGVLLRRLADQAHRGLDAAVWDAAVAAVAA